MSRTETWRDQRERRFRVAPERTDEVVGTLDERLQRVTYTPGSQRSLVVTTYLDSPERAYLHTIEKTHGHLSLKMRVREYLAIVEGSDELSHGTTCFLERKERVGDLRIKQRVELDKRRIAPVLSRTSPLGGSDTVICALRDELDKHPLEPVLVTCYQRRVYGDGGQLRVTLDDHLQFYAAPESIYDRIDALTLDALGQPLGELESHILEVKEPRGGHTPAWLEELFGQLDPADRFSKFREGMSYLDGEQSSKAASTR